MIPKFRAWISEADTMVNDLKGIDFENETVVLRKLYYEDGFPVETEVFEVEIGNAILMQSTGLKDMNNREIFEGDIVSVGTATRVVKKNNSLGFYIEEGEKIGYFSDVVDVNCLDLFVKDFGEEAEIIGNIYENKELLDA